jgi:hypothetical protein
MFLFGIKAVYSISHLKTPHRFTTPFCRFCTLFLSLDARLVIEASLFNFCEKALLGQLSLESPDGPFYVVILNNDFHISFTPNALELGDALQTDSLQ